MDTIKVISEYIIPLMVVVILVSGIYKNVKIYDCFIEGAKDGMHTVIKILPHLIGLMVAIGVIRASGTIEIIAYAISPVTKALKIPAEVLPLALLRPVSGSASLAVVSDLINTYGPDSFIGRVTSTMMGSTETTFYTLAVYFGAVGIKKIRHSVFCALLADITGIICSVWICGIIFGWS